MAVESSPEGCSGCKQQKVIGKSAVFLFHTCVLPILGVEHDIRDKADMLCRKRFQSERFKMKNNP